MKLLFLRHGQTNWNLENKIQGSSDTMLNDQGIEQAKKLAKNILKSNHNICKIYTSKQMRAIDTAKILSLYMTVDYEVVEGLEEINFGEWEGLSWNEIKDKFPEEYIKWCNNRRYSKSHQGESYQEMLERVLKAIKNIISKNRENVIVVTHSGVIMALQCYLTKTSFSDIGNFRLDNMSVCELDK